MGKWGEGEGTIDDFVFLFGAQTGEGWHARHELFVHAPLLHERAAPKKNAWRQRHAETQIQTRTVTHRETETETYTRTHARTRAETRHRNTDTPGRVSVFCERQQRTPEQWAENATEMTEEWAEDPSVAPLHNELERLAVQREES